MCRRWNEPFADCKSDVMRRKLRLKEKHRHVFTVCLELRINSEIVFKVRWFFSPFFLSHLLAVDLAFIIHNLFSELLKGDTASEARKEMWGQLEFSGVARRH